VNYLNISRFRQFVKEARLISKGNVRNTCCSLNSKSQISTVS